MLEQQPTILTLEQHGVKMEVRLPSSDINIEEFNDALVKLLKASGYHIETLLTDLRDKIEENDY
jgi:hypothetical protein